MRETKPYTHCSRESIDRQTGGASTREQEINNEIEFNQRMTCNEVDRHHTAEPSITDDWNANGTTCHSNEDNTESSSHSHKKPLAGCLRLSSIIKQNFSNNKERTLSAFKSLFYHLGGHIFDHPVWYIVCASLVALTCAVAFLFIHFETRADLLYALPASRARSDLAKQTALFGRPARVNMVFILSADNSSILTAPVLRKLKRLDDYIKYELRSPMKIAVTKPFGSLIRDYNETLPEPVSFAYQDICYRMQLPDVDFSGVIGERDETTDKDTVKMKVPDCHSMSPLDFYRNEKHYGTPLSTRQWPYIPNIIGNKIVKADLTLTDPDVRRLPSGTTRLFNATGFLLFYHTLSAPTSALAQSLEWEGALIDFINKDIKPYAANYVKRRGQHVSHTRNPNMAPFLDKDWGEFQVFVNAARSWQDELGRSTSFDARLMRDYVLSFCIIAAYMVLANRTNNLVRSKSTCGFLGAVSAFMGYIYGGGICYWLGLRHTPTMHASPFLVLAIGLDNTFVVLNFYTLAFTYVKNPRERCRMALRDSGISLTITTFTSIISFLVGAAGPYLAVRNFCLVTALGLLGGFIANIVFFYPFLCLESIAESEGKPHFLPIVPAWIYHKLPGSCFTIHTKYPLQHDQSSHNEPLNTSSTRPSGLPDTFPNTDEHLKTKCDPFQTIERQWKLDPSQSREIELSGTNRKPTTNMRLNVPGNNFNNTANARINDYTPSTSPRSNHYRHGGGFRSTIDDPQTLLAQQPPGQTMGRLARFWRHHHHQHNHPPNSRRDNNNQHDADSDVFDGAPPFESSTGGFIPSAPATGSMETVADSAECFQINPSSRRQMALAIHQQREAYLSETLLQGRSLFEVASIQWRFRRRRHELKKELIRRGLKIPRRGTSQMLWTNWHISEEERRILDSPTFDLVESDAKLVPQGVITPLYKACDLVVRMSEEPDGNNGKWSRGFFLKKLGPLWSKRWLQVLVMSILALYIGLSLYGAVAYLTAGLDLENLTPPDSYLREAFKLSHDKFPIFPYETNVVFTAPNLTVMRNSDGFGTSSDGERRLLETFAANSYGTRKASDLKPLTENDLAAHSGSGDSDSVKMVGYLDSLGEVPWWEPRTLEALLEFDRMVRTLDSTQDVLNGLLLFFSETASKIFIHDTTANERRRLFHTHLYKYLSTGVVGQHVRNQFLFTNPLPTDPDYLPRLLGFKLTIFNYNFLNSFAQSQYMTTIRKLADTLSMPWDTVIGGVSDTQKLTDDDPTVPEDDINELIMYPPPPKQENQEFSFNDTKMDIIRGQGSWFSVKPFMETFLFFESDVTILRSTIINMSTAFIAIILASSLLMRGMTTAVLVTFIICAVDLGIFGAMGYWGIHLNILSMILLVLSIGFSVDYTVHVVHTFAHAVGSTRIDKTVETLILMCNPVTHGAISTALGILPIYFRQEFIMETFFKMTFLVVSFGFLNGVIFLPIILALRGPIIDSTEAKSHELKHSIQCVIQPLLMDDLVESQKLKVDSAEIK